MSIKRTIMRRLRVAGGVMALAWAVGAQPGRAQVYADRAAALVVFPYVVVDTANGRNTFIELSNISGQPIGAHCFFENDNSHCGGDGPSCDDLHRCAGSGSCVAGWQETDFNIRWTARQPLAWRASDGLSAAGLPLPTGVCSRNVIHKCATDADCSADGPCTQSNIGTSIPPVPEDPFTGALRCFVIDDQGNAVPDNALTGDATVQIFHTGPPLVDDVARYSAIGIPAIGGDVNRDGVLALGDGSEYNGCPGFVSFNQIFDGASDPIAGANRVDNTLILVPCSADYLAQIPGDAAVSYVVTNEFGQRTIGATPFTVRGQLVSPLAAIDAGAFSAAAQGTLTGMTRLVSDGSAVIGLLLETHSDRADPTHVSSALRGLPGAGVGSEPDHLCLGVCPTSTPTAITTPTSPVTATSTVTATPTPTSTTTASSTSTVTSTATPETSDVEMVIGEARARPGDIVSITVSLSTGGRAVAATANDIVFDPDAFEVDPAECRVNPALPKSLIPSVSRPGRLVVFVQATPSTNPIPDGPLYVCHFHIGTATFPNRYPLTGTSTSAFAADGAPLAQVRGRDGAITVSLVPVRGDVNHDGQVDAADLPGLLASVFGDPLTIEADANDDSAVGAADIAALFHIL